MGQMNKKHIVIIGGGISGLSLLHFLKIKYYFRDDIKITLLEKNESLGGTIQTIRKSGCLWEAGPNGFLDSKPRTLQLIQDLNLTDHILKASPQAQKRFINLQNKLIEVPTNPIQFLSSPILSWKDKVRILKEPFIPKGDHPEESVYDFAKRRLGEGFAKTLMDPMVRGIFAGDVKHLHLKSAFPRIYALEQQYGSLIKAAILLRRAKKTSGKITGSPTGTLTSFTSGMSQMISAFGFKYKENIDLNQNVLGIVKSKEKYIISTDFNEYEADYLFLSTPAYVAAHLTQRLSLRLAQELDKIVYAPVAIVSFLFPQTAFENPPQGFGYLNPTKEGRDVLGVLFESNIYPNRCGKNQILLRVMVGGAGRVDILDKTKEELLAMGLKEIHHTLRVKAEAVDDFVHIWPKAIPQYDALYPKIHKNIEAELSGLKQIGICSNYWGGVAFNDCIENAFQTAEILHLG
jgi:oxygen-dependent protoporphyrinogen oxidase